MTDTRSVCYIAATSTAAHSGATALEDVATGLSVEPLQSPFGDGAVPPTIEDALESADCLVFAETPTTAEGADLFDLLAYSDRTPVVLYSSTSYGPGAAQSTDGIDGYVRQNGDGSFAHLADEIEWVCRRRQNEHDATTATHESQIEGRYSLETITALHEMATEIVACRTEDRLFELAIETAEDVLGFDACSFSIKREGEHECLTVVAASSTDGSGPRQGETTDIKDGEIPGILGRTYHEGRSFLIEDATTEPDSRPYNDAYRSAISVPVGSFGVFQAISTECKSYDETDLEMAKLLIAHVEETLQRIRLESALHRHRERLAKLHEGTTGIAGATDEDSVFERALETAETVIELDICVLLSVDTATDELVPRAYSEEMDDSFARRVPTDYGVVGEAFRSGESSRIEDIKTDNTVEDEWEYHSVLTVPIGEYGVFQAVSKEINAFDDDDQELLELLCAHVTEALARARAETELVDERDRLSALFENIPDPAVQYELSGNAPSVKAVNDRFETVFGFDEATILDEDIDEYIIPEGFEEEAARLNKALREGKTLRATTRRRTKTEIRDFLVNVVPLTLGERGVEGYAIYTDITDQKRRERALKAQNERLDEFASIVSHDLRNPLNVARGYLELYEETGDSEHFEEVDDALKRMGELIDKLLSLAKQGNVIDETEPVAIHDTARRAWSVVDTGEARLKLEQDSILEADRSRFEELLENLLRNAVTHGKPDGSLADLTISVGAFESGFYVEDNGVGIPPEKRETVFESGYTTAIDGTGFGLSIVEQIADAHGWTVLIKTSAEGGARFEFIGANVDIEDGADDNTVSLEDGADDDFVRLEDDQSRTSHTSDSATLTGDEEPHEGLEGEDPDFLEEVDPSNIGETRDVDNGIESEVNNAKTEPIATNTESFTSKIEVDSEVDEFTASDSQPSSPDDDHTDEESSQTVDDLEQALDGESKDDRGEDLGLE